MFGYYFMIGTVLLIAIVGTIYFTWQDRKNAREQDTEK
jgi:hypothetical protein